MNGIINILKPPGMTSHDVVSFIRKTINIKKVGHTGTLDPNASGVLPICVGKATRVVQYFDDFTKIYRAELTLGYETDTQDKYGKLINSAQVPDLTREVIENTFNEFKGKIKQIPPMYSAIKYKGKKLYELAREGKVIERKPREVIIHNINIVNITDMKRIMFDVECSKGTYIRTLCSDIGKKLGTFGCMTFLLRTQVGDYKIENSYTLEEVQEFFKNNQFNKILIPIDTALKHFDQISFNKNYFKLLKNGGKVSINEGSRVLNCKEGKKFRVYCEDMFIGIGMAETIDKKLVLRMDKVFI